MTAGEPRSLYAAEIASLVLCIACLVWACWLLWHGDQILFMLPVGLAVVFAGGAGGGNNGDCDPCMGA